MSMSTNTARRAAPQARRQESRQSIAKFFKFFVGIAMIPACLGICISTWRIYLSQYMILREQLWFIAGFAAYVLIYSVLQNPIKTYVFGHELSHAIWTWMFRGKVSNFRAGASGGSVTVSKTNVFISLAPYFFPVYTVLTVVLYMIAKAFWKVEPYFEVYRFVLGFTWAFHCVLTVYVLLKGQEDVRENGSVFSIFFICFANALCFGLLWVYLSDHVTLTEYFRRLWEQIGFEYSRVFSLSGMK